MIIISFSRQNLTGWEKKRYAVILRKTILKIIQISRDIRNMTNFINIEVHIKLNRRDVKW